MIIETINKILNMCIIGLVISGTLFLIGLVPHQIPFVFIMGIVAVLFFAQRVMTIDDDRSERAQNTDYRKCAKNAWLPQEVADDITKANKWFNNPNRFDIIGVDAKSTCPSTKRKKATKKTAKKKRR